MAIEALIVDTLEDESDGIDVGGVSLRDALAAIDPGGTITFADELMGTIVLGGTELVIDRTVNIDGDGDITVDANSQSRVFSVSDGSDDTEITVAISGLTISGGVSDFGGGIENDENLTLNNSIVTGNLSATGGGILNGYSTLNLIDSTVSGNSVINFGGGIAAFSAGGNLNLSNSTISSNSADYGGGILLIPDATGFNPVSTSVGIVNSTISSNSAAIDGGGLLNLGGLVTLSNSTVTANTAGNDGSGIASFGDAETQTTITSSIVSGNVGTDIDVVLGTINSFASNGNNLIGDGNATIAFSSDSDITGNTDPGLAPLADNGGPTQTIALLPGSPAIDAGSNPDGLPNDQRGAGFSRVNGTAADIGAFEAGAVNALPTFTSPAAVSVAENTTAVVTLTADDADGDELSFSVSGGADQAAFVIADPLTGALAFQVAPDFENPSSADGDNVFEVEVSVTDGINDPVVQALTITVTDNPDIPPIQNSAPTFTSPALVSVVENTTAVVILTADDADGDELSFSVSGGADQAAFVIADPLTGALAFQVAPDFENPSSADGDNVFEVEVSVTDGINDPVVQSLTVALADEPADDLGAPPPSGPVNLDIDGEEGVVPSVDVLNIFRILAGAPQAVVVPDGANVSQQDIADVVDAFPDLGLDVDGNGEIVPAVDVLNIFRVLAGAPQAVVIPDGLDIGQQAIADAVNALIA